MNKFASLLKSKWTNATNTSEITGRWAGDEVTYTLKAPPQLVSSIIAMQNYVYDLNKEIEDREKCITRLTKELEEMKVARGYR